MDKTMTLEQVRDWLQNCAISNTESSDIRNDFLGEMADAIDAAIKSREAEPVYQLHDIDENVWIDCKKWEFDSVEPSCRKRILYTAPPAQPKVEVTDAMVERACISWVGGYAAWNRMRGKTPMSFRNPLRAALEAALSQEPQT